MKVSLLALLCVLCAACSTYQYVTVSSPLKADNGKDFVVENDTLRIAYDFNGAGGRVTIAIYNKLAIPLYVDWAKSALIVGDTRTSYSDKTMSLSAEVSGSGTQWSNYRSQTAVINGTVSTAEVSGFIPPKAQAKEALLTLNPKFFPLPDATGKKYRRNEEGVNVKYVSYQQHDSPFTFRSFLTLSTSADLTSPIHFDHAFWVSDVFQTTLKPKNFQAKPNRFHIRKTSGTGAVVLGAGMVGAIVLGFQYQKEKASFD